MKKASVFNKKVQKKFFGYFENDFLVGCKLKMPVVERLMSSDLSGCAIDILLWLSTKQTNRGVVEEIKYYMVSEETKSCYQTFYNGIKELEKQGFIEILDNDRAGGWKIQIKDNEFLSEQDYKVRYLNTNRAFLFDKLFLDLKPNEKKLVLKVLTFYKNDKAYITFNNISNWLGVNQRKTIINYMNTLKLFFRVVYKKSQSAFWLFKAINNKVHINNGYTDFENYFSHRLKVLCRKLKVYIADDRVLLSVIELINRFRWNIGYYDMFEIIHNSVIRLGELNNYYISTVFSRTREALRREKTVQNTL